MVKKRLLQDSILSSWTNFTPDYICDLLDLCLMTTYFQQSEGFSSAWKKLSLDYLSQPKPLLQVCNTSQNPSKGSGSLHRTYKWCGQWHQVHTLRCRGDIEHTKEDQILNIEVYRHSVPQNPPLFTPRCKILLLATVGQGNRPPLTRFSSAFLLSFSLTWCPPLIQLLILKGSSPPPPTGLPALKISSSGPNKCGELQAAFAAGPKNYPLQQHDNNHQYLFYKDWGRWIGLR